MKKAMIALALCCAAGPAVAAEQVINLTATVSGSCSISDSASPSAVTQALTINGDGHVSTTPVTMTFPVACNGPSTLQMTSSNYGLVGPGTVAGYVNKIGYTAVTSGVFAAPFTLNVPLGAPQPPVETDVPAAGDLVLTITPQDQGKLVKGSYSDALHLVITPLQ
ncbi:hypothetical protein [Hyphomicrobium sp. DY-1]|jgi:hypothetical protein|uniref:hypothetical protein n=1 Tax=Hyphomicrobium sp. DY-1 TaxID=3075650 RepID=UPI0039C0F81B